MPVSTTATMTDDLPPGSMSQAREMSMAERFHWRAEKPGSFGTIARGSSKMSRSLNAMRLPAVRGPIL